MVILNFSFHLFWAALLFVFVYPSLLIIFKKGK